MMDDWEYDETPCPRCGETPTKRRYCSELGCEDGWIDLYDEDPNFYMPGEQHACPECHGCGVVRWCGVCGYEIRPADTERSITEP